MINDVSRLGPISPQRETGGGEQKVDSKGPSFQDLLKEKSKVPVETAIPTDIKFSAHAADRMASRKIKLDPFDITKLEQGIEKARLKGSQNTLMLLGENAFIVNVKNSTVVTAMDRAMMKENVFTNIDSTIVL
jgi:flagellar operon protein